MARVAKGLPGLLFPENDLSCTENARPTFKGLVLDFLDKRGTLESLSKTTMMVLLRCLSTIDTFMLIANFIIFDKINQNIQRQALPGVMPQRLALKGTIM